MVDSFNPGTQEAEKAGSLLVQDQDSTQSEIQDKWVDTEKPCVKKQARNGEGDQTRTFFN